jgi:hypothetical protein
VRLGEEVMCKCRLALIVCLLSATAAHAGSLSDEITRSLAQQQVIDRAADRAFDDAVKKLNLDQKTKMEILFDTLHSISDEDAYFLKAVPDPCSASEVLQCDGLPGATVKPFITMEIDKRIAARSAQDAHRTYNLSRWAFVVSLFSTAVSVLALFRSSRGRPTGQVAT